MADVDLRADQAAGLRRLFRLRAPQVVAFAAGREACGRTSLLVQTAAALAASGHGVTIIDENPEPANVLSAFGLYAPLDLLHAALGACSLRQATLSAAPLIRIVAAARAVRELDQDDPEVRRRLADCLNEAARGADFVLIDSAAQRGGRLSALACAARHLAVVVAAHGGAITDAYALIKSMALTAGRDAFQVVVTRARGHDEAHAIFANMKRLAGERLGVRLDYLGAAMVPAAEHLADALTTRLPAVAEHGRDGGLAFRPSPANVPGIVMV